MRQPLFQEMIDATRAMFAARAALEIAPTHNNKVFDEALAVHDEALGRLAAALTSATQINREQAGWLAFHDGRAFKDHEYSPGSLSEREWQAGWTRAHEGTDWQFMLDEVSA